MSKIQKPNFYEIAAGEFTSGHTDKDLSCLEDLMAAFDSGDLCAWKLFDNLEVEDIHEHICDLAARFENLYYLGKRDATLEIDGEYVLDDEKETIEVGDIVWYDNLADRDKSYYEEVHSLVKGAVVFPDEVEAHISQVTLLKVKA